VSAVGARFVKMSLPAVNRIGPSIATGPDVEMLPA
jgi:hypothetical protein